MNIRSLPLQKRMHIAIHVRMVDAVGSATFGSPAEKSDSGAVRSLIDVIKKEESVVVVNLDDRVQVSLCFGVLVLFWAALDVHNRQ